MVDIDKLLSKMRQRDNLTALNKECAEEQKEKVKALNVGLTDKQKYLRSLRGFKKW